MHGRSTYASSQTGRANCKTTKLQTNAPQRCKTMAGRTGCKTQDFKPCNKNALRTLLLHVFTFVGFAIRSYCHCFASLGCAFCILVALRLSRHVRGMRLCMLAGRGARWAGPAEPATKEAAPKGRSAGEGQELCENQARQIIKQARGEG